MTAKITLIGTLPPIKGNSYYCKGLAEGLSKKLNVEFISFKKLYPDFLYPGSSFEKSKDFQVKNTISLRIIRLITYYNPFSWIAAGLKSKTKIVHSQWWSMPIAPIFFIVYSILKIRGKKIVITVHNVIPHEKSVVDKILTKIVLRFADRLIVHTKKNKGDIKELYGYENVDIIPMPIHDMYPDNITRTEARKMLKIKDEFVLLAFGNLREYKGIDLLIKSLKILDVKLLIVGQPWQGNDHIYRKLAKNNGVEDKVDFHFGYVPTADVAKYFKAVDLVCLPYKYFDAQSGVGNIALAFDKPMIVSDVGGLPDLVLDKTCIVKPDDVNGFVQAVNKIMNDKKLYSKLVDDSKKLKKKYSWDNFIEKNIEVYSSLDPESFP